MAFDGKNLFDFFPNISREIIMEGFKCLSEESQEKLKFVFGDNLDDTYNLLRLSSEEKNRINSIIYSNLKKKIEENSNRQIFNSKFNRKKEIILIKKAKLSYYNELSDDLKELYLNYYFEMFPQFKIKYENASDDEKNVLLIEAINDSKKWRDKFFNSNLGLVGYVASKYSNCNYEDFFQEGMFGLDEALKRYDLSKNTKFSTYAVIWIRRYIIKHLNGNRSIIKTPANIGGLFKKLNAINFNYYAQNRCYPSDELLSEMAGCSIGTVEKFREYNYYMENPVHLDATARDGGKEPISYFVEDKELEFQDDADNELIAADVLKIIDNIFDSRTKYILVKRYGLDGGGVHSLRKIGDEIGLSPQRISMIEKKALDKIRDYRFNKKHLVYVGARQSGSFVNSIYFKMMKLYYVDGMTFNDIAAEFNVDVVDVIDIISDGLVKIRKEYSYENGKILRKRL